MGQLVKASREPKNKIWRNYIIIIIIIFNFKVPMGPFTTCKGPEGDKLQGTMPKKFFRINFGTHYSKLKNKRMLQWASGAVHGDGEPIA